MGGNAIKKTESSLFVDSVFFPNVESTKSEDFFFSQHFPPYLGLCFFFTAEIGDAEVELLPDDLRLFYGYFWQILTNRGYFMATVWLILATPGYSWTLSVVSQNCLAS